MSDIEILGTQIDNLATKIDSERDATRRGNRLRNVGLVVLFAIALGNVWTIHQANNAKHDARAAACLRANQEIDDINGILTKIAIPAAGQVRTPEQQAAIDARVKGLKLPRRDCSPNGIDIFYNKEKAK